ncbi:regulator of DNA class I crossover intermediates 1 [Tiliqua scincoides]|uniref:regulator of DNA class I crossover intermediates 1 n=1 Tax=Tiliqua scincoides TaxID=71010 RepID=UPI0034633D76
MNWVGGSRKRIMLTKERRKQKEFFEKERLKSKMKLLNISPLKSSGVSLDLLNLYVVNQIANKKDLPDKVRKPVYVDINSGIKIPQRRHNVELPKSPEGRPPEPFPVAIQNRVQQQILENRRKYLLEKDKFHSQYQPSSQPVNFKCESSWLPKAAHRQRNLSDSDVGAREGRGFQQLNSQEYNNSFGKSSKVTAGTNFGNHKKEGSLFASVNYDEIIKATQGESGYPIAALFEEKNEQLTNLPSSEFHCSFANENIWDQLLTDPSATNEISNEYGPYGSQEMHQRASCAQSAPAERVLQSIFTAPEQIFTQCTQSLSVIKQEPMKNWLKDDSIQERNLLRFTEQQENNPDSESTGGLINEKKTITVAEMIKKLLNRDKKDRAAETNLNHLHIFGLEETENAFCNYHDQSLKPGGQQDDESELSSQSPSYSPKQTDSYARTTSDESEQEDQDESKSSYCHNSFPRHYDNPLTESQRSECIHQSMDVSSIFQDCKAKGRANIQTMQGRDRRKDAAALPVFACKHANSKARHSAWSQTEKCAEEIKKSNVAVQCDIMQACNCKNEVSSVQSAEMVTSTAR